MYAAKTTARLALRCTALSALLINAPALAHNGQIALAYPVAGIEIDGDLADWPDALAWHPIALTGYGQPPRDGRDLRARFRLGYDRSDNALYLAVATADESTVVDTSAQWDTQDGCEIYLDWGHAGEGRSVQYALHGDSRRGRGFAVARRRTATTHYYEWRIEAPQPLTPDRGIGLDLVVCDKDADGSYSWVAWGRGANKYFAAERLGDALLVAPGLAPGRIQGRVQWRDTGAGVAQQRLDLRSLSSPALQTAVVADRDGFYAATLPPGDYTVAWRRAPTAGDSAAVQIAAGQTLTHSLAIAPPAAVAPVKKAATAPRVLRSGAHYRRDDWLVFGVAAPYPEHQVSSMLQDRDGAIWFGTYSGGFSRYDGQQLAVFGVALIDRPITCMLEDRDGKIWIGTGLDRSKSASGSGVWIYDDGRITRLSPERGFPSYNITSMAQDRAGDLWFGTPLDGLIRYDGRQFETYSVEDGLPHAAINCLLADPRGGLWIGTGQGSFRGEGIGGLVHYDGRRFETFNTADGLPHNVINALFAADDGRLWVGTRTGLARQRLADADLRFERFADADGLPPGEILSLAADADGHLWIGAARGLTRYDGRRFEAFAAEAGLPHSEVYVVFSDRENYLWVGGREGGVSRYEGRYITSFTQKKRGFAHEHAVTVLEDRDGDLWFGTMGGLARKRAESFEYLTRANGLPDDLVTALATDADGRLWIGTRAGLARKKEDGFDLFTVADGLPSNEILTLLPEADGQLWIGTRAGLARKKGAAVETFTVADGLPHNDTRALLRDRDGRLWVGTRTGLAYQDDRGGPFAAPAAGDYSESGEIHSLYQDRGGRIWLGTGRGVRYVERPDERTPRTQAYALEALDWLPAVTSIIEDDQGHLWFGTNNHGIVRSDGEVSQRLVRQDGLAHDAVTAMTQTRGGDIWIATKAGATRYSPYSAPPRVAVAGIEFGGQLHATDAVQLVSSEPYLTVHLQSGSFKTRPDGMQYRYRLRGHDDAWRTTGDPAVTYHGLGDGHYTFEAHAIDRDLTYSAAPATARIDIRPDYERIGWFGALCLAAVLAGWQTHRLVQRDQHLNRSNAALHLALAREEIMGEVRDRLTAMRQVTDLPDEAYWVAAIRDLGVPAAGFSLQFPGSDPDHFTTLFLETRRYSDDTPLARFPWVQEAWRRGAPVVVARPRLEAAGLADWSVQAILEVPLPTGSLGVNSMDPAAFDEEAVRVVQVFAGLIAIGLRRIEDFATLRRANAELLSQIEERRRIEARHAQLDEQLHHLRYLEKLRSALEGARTVDQIMRSGATALLEALSATVAGGGVRIEAADRTWALGQCDLPDQRHYVRPLKWGERDNCRLHLFCATDLSEAQKRALLGETAEQIVQVLAARDLTAQLMQSARLVSLGQMAAGVAHELNQPLSAISAAAASADMRLGEGRELSPERVRGIVRKILAMVERMGSTIGHLRLFSRDTSAEPGRHFAINQVVEDSLQIIGTQLAARDIAVDLDLAADLPRLHGHPHQLEQVVLNLLANARDALDEADLPAGGRRIRVGTAAASGRVALEVADNGVGIDEENRTRLFEPFFTTKEADRGTGLGLSISYAIVKNHGGNITCESYSGRGASFRVDLPAAEEQN